MASFDDARKRPPQGMESVLRLALGSDVFHFYDPPDLSNQIEHAQEIVIMMVNVDVCYSFYDSHQGDRLFVHRHDAMILKIHSGLFIMKQ